MKALTCVTIGLLLSMAAPASAGHLWDDPPAAATPPPVAGPPPVELRSPWVAPLLSVGGGLGLVAASWLFPPAMVVAPFGLGLGYAYARDPVRGLGAGAGSYLIVGSAWLFGALAVTELGSSSSTEAQRASGLQWAMVAGAVYGVLALGDVALTTVRINQEQKGAALEAAPSGVTSPAGALAPGGM